MKTVYVIHTPTGAVRVDNQTLFFNSKQGAKKHPAWSEAKQLWHKVSIRSRKVLNEVEAI